MTPRLPTRRGTPEGNCLLCGGGTKSHEPNCPTLKRDHPGGY
jgi:hypothetical protein